MIQLRNVPDALHRSLKAKAAMAGMSLSDYLLAEIREPTEIEQDFLSLLQANFPHLVSLLSRSAPPMPSLSKAAATGR